MEFGIKFPIPYEFTQNLGPGLLLAGGWLVGLLAGCSVEQSVVGCLVGLLASCLVGSFVAWPRLAVVSWLLARLDGKPNGWLACWLPGWVTGDLIGWSVRKLAGFFVDDWLLGFLIF